LINFTPQPFYIGTIAPGIHLIREWMGIRAVLHVFLFLAETRDLSQPGIETRLLSYPVLCLATIFSEVAQLQTLILSFNSDP